MTGLVLKGSPRHDHSKPKPTFISGQNPQVLLHEMASRLRSYWRNTVQQKLPSFRRASNVSPPTLPLKTPVEEETLPYYKPEHYYPVNIGDVYEARYQIVGKLGYGAYSTSWLCHDLQYVSRCLIITVVSFPSDSRYCQEPQLWCTQSDHVASKIPHGNRSRVEDLSAPYKSTVHAPRPVSNTRAL